MTNESIIDRIYKENLELLKFLEQKNEPTFVIQFNTIFAKTLLLSAASYFEYEICKMIMSFVERKANNNEYIISLIKSKAIERQYHTYFEWDGKNANKFFALFGNTFKEDRNADIKSNQKLKDAIRSFLELGNERNKLVHKNFADCTLDKTAEEVYLLYQQATIFMDFFLRVCLL